MSSRTVFSNYPIELTRWISIYSMLSADSIPTTTNTNLINIFSGADGTEYTFPTFNINP